MRKIYYEISSNFDYKTVSFVLWVHTVAPPRDPLENFHPPEPRVGCGVVRTETAPFPGWMS